MCRVRSIREAARYFRDMDPDTQITEWTLRRLIADKTIPAVKTGSKYLVNLDTVLEIFYSSNGSIKTGKAPVVIDK